MIFNSNWSRPHKYDPSIHDSKVLDDWDCQGKAGIYVIRDEFDQRTLYVGKAEGTSCDIHTRLTKHLTDRGNAGIGDLVKHRQRFTIRWAECEHPSLSESIAITQLSPLFNKRAEWVGIDRVSVDTCMKEAERLGLITSKDVALERLGKAVAEQIFRSSTPLEKERLSQLERDKNCISKLKSLSEQKLSHTNRNLTPYQDSRFDRF